MHLVSSLLDGLRELGTQRKRAISSLLGFAWGTFGVVGIMAFGTGLEDLMRERAEGMGKGVVVAWGMRTTKSFEGLPEGRRILISDEDVVAMVEQIPALEAISPEYIRYERLQTGGRVFRPSISGVHPSYAGLRNMGAAPGGRFINERDVREARSVMFLGNVVRDQLFGDADPIGRTVLLRGTPFTVVGALEPKLQDSDYEGQDENRICIPSSSFRNVFGDRWIDYLVYSARAGVRTERATEEVYRCLGRRLRFDPTDTGALRVWDTNQFDRIRDQSFRAMDLLISLACVLTLLVSGIGVGNLMFLVVRRRTREIGIQMALGARPRWIMRDVLVQTLVLVALGGALGFLAAWALSAGIGLSPFAEQLGKPRISFELAAGTTALLGAIGLSAGWFPARRAARLDPVRALAE